MYSLKEIRAALTPAERREFDMLLSYEHKGKEFDCFGCGERLVWNGEPKPYALCDECQNKLQSP